MLNPVPFQVEADDLGLRLGVPRLDPADHRTLEDTGLTRAQWEDAMRARPRFSRAAFRHGLHRLVADLFAEARRTLSRG